MSWVPGRCKFKRNEITDELVNLDSEETNLYRVESVKPPISDYFRLLSGWVGKLGRNAGPHARFGVELIRQKIYYFWVSTGKLYESSLGEEPVDGLQIDKIYLRCAKSRRSWRLWSTFTVTDLDG